MIRKVTVLAAAALISAGTLFSQEEISMDNEQFQALLAQLQRPSEPAKIEDVAAALPDVIGQVFGKDYTKEAFIAKIAENVQILNYIGDVKAEGFMAKIVDIASSMMQQDMLTQVLKEDGAWMDEAKIIEFAKEQIAALPTEQRAMLDAELEAKNVTFDELIKEQINDDVIFQVSIENWLKQKVEAGGVDSEEKLKAYYAENQDMFQLDGTELAASHILFMLPPNTPEEEKDNAFAELLVKANAALARIKAGEKFEDVAAELSDCPSKEKGGNLGIFRQEQMVTEFSQAVILLAPETMAEEPVKTPFGYHIIRRNVTPEVVPFEEAKDTVTQMVVGDYVTDMITELTEKNIKMLITAGDAE